MTVCFSKSPTCPASRPNTGFTLIELLVSLSILSIIMALGLPSFTDIFKQQRLISATEQLYSHLQQARMESIARSASVTLNFTGTGTTSWLYGFSQGAAVCDLTKEAPTEDNACRLVVNDGDANIYGLNGGDDTADLVLYRFSGSDFSDVKLDLTNFSSAISDKQITFDPTRGISDAGDISLISDMGHKLKIKISRLGMIKVCSPDGSVNNYSKVNC